MISYTILFLLAYPVMSARTVDRTNGSTLKTENEGTIELQPEPGVEISGAETLEDLNMKVTCYVDARERSCRRISHLEKNTWHKRFLPEPVCKKDIHVYFEKDHGLYYPYITTPIPPKMKSKKIYLMDPEGMKYGYNGNDRVRTVGCCLSVIKPEGKQRPGWRPVVIEDYADNDDGHEDQPGLNMSKHMAISVEKCEEGDLPAWAEDSSCYSGEQKRQCAVIGDLAKGGMFGFGDRYIKRPVCNQKTFVSFAKQKDGTYHPYMEAQLVTPTADHSTKRKLRVKFRKRSFKKGDGVRIDGCCLRGPRKDWQPALPSDVGGGGLNAVKLPPIHLRKCNPKNPDEVLDAGPQFRPHELEDAEGAEEEVWDDESGEFHLEDNEIKPTYDNECNHGKGGEKLKGENGAGYRGCQTKTRSGRICQKWNAKAPHKPNRAPAQFPNAGLGAHNYCRNPDKNDGIWCYTMDPEERWELCDPLKPEEIFECDETFDVETKGADYRGCQTQTMNGRTCQAWTDTTPHKPSRNPKNMPGKGLGDHNYCRNPDDNDSIWCYTKDPEVRWELCIPKPVVPPEQIDDPEDDAAWPDDELEDCSPELEVVEEEDKGAGYRGCQTKTRTGRTCIKWTAKTKPPLTRTPEKLPNAGLGDHNFCRNPDGNDDIWCYTSDAKKRWDFCDPLEAPPQPTQDVSQDCDPGLEWTIEVEDKGAGYRGCQTKTRTGRTCIKWTAEAKPPLTRTPEKFPNAGLGDHNFCRNPDGNEDIWCYTSDPEKRWDFCDPIETPGLQSTLPPSTTTPAPILGPDEQLHEDVGPDEQLHEDVVPIDNGQNCDPAFDVVQLEDMGASYRGCQTKTRTCRTCIKWTADTQPPLTRTPETYPNKGLGDHDFCRNPDENDGIWCYTSDSEKRWDFCDPLEISPDAVGDLPQPTSPPSKPVPKPRPTPKPRPQWTEQNQEEVEEEVDEAGPDDEIEANGEEAQPASVKDAYDKYPWGADEQFPWAHGEEDVEGWYENEEDEEDGPLKTRGGPAFDGHYSLPMGYRGLLFEDPEGTDINDIVERVDLDHDFGVDMVVTRGLP